MQLRNTITSALGLSNPAYVPTRMHKVVPQYHMQLDVFTIVGVAATASCVASLCNAAHDVGMRNGAHACIKQDVQNLYRENNRLQTEIAYVRNTTLEANARNVAALLEIEKRNTLYLHLLYRITENKCDIGEELRSTIDRVETF